MIDFSRLRQSMVDSQIRPNDVTDLRLIAAMLELPRERFVPASRSDLAYLDDDLPVSDAEGGKPARYLIEPMVLAKLIQALDLSEEDRVLDVGCTTGYSTAVLARIAGSVVGLEEDADLATAARNNLHLLGIGNAEIVLGPLGAGAAGKGPFDAILINGSVELIPEPLFAQLKDGGRLVAVVRTSPPGRATIYMNAAGIISHRPLFEAAVPPLHGFAAPRGFVF
ncbi:MAG: protein-L-isoaspartate O-methyltransferase [Bradyrhizobiaceae bacterium]|nr:protein-L-isoaspartate O-methyltransferase [Bradyrhizobiaceae bacterium]